MSTATEYRIEEGTQPDGSHWASMRPAGEHLQREVDFMAALVRLSQESLEPGDLDTLELTDSELASGYDGYEEAWSALDSWMLEMRHARWEIDRSLARVVVVLGTGGPHVELQFDCDHMGRVERITLERRWSGTSDAFTDDTRACAVADDFLSILIPE